MIIDSAIAGLVFAIIFHQILPDMPLIYRYR